jgi:transcriptional regulator with XRE-family HTH domain
MESSERRQAFGRRLRQRLAELGWSQAELARRLGGFDRSVVNRWLSGTNELGSSLLARICDLLGVSADWLLGLPPMENPTFDGHRFRDDYELLPKVLDQVAAGEAVFDPSPQDTWYAFRRRWLMHRPGWREPGRYVVVQVATSHKGESMMPAVQPGAMVVIDRGPGCNGFTEVDDGKVYLVRIDEGFMLKRLFRTGDQLILWSDNLAFKPRTVSLRHQEIQEIVRGRVCLVMQEDV